MHAAVHWARQLVERKRKRKRNRERENEKQGERERERERDRESQGYLSVPRTRPSGTSATGSPRGPQFYFVCAVLLTSLYEQRHFYANKSKTEVCHLCLKPYNTRCTPVKRVRKLPGFPCIHFQFSLNLIEIGLLVGSSKSHGQHPERHQKDMPICMIRGR